MTPTEYGSPYKGIFFGTNKSKPSLSILGSRIGSKNELRSPIVRSKGGEFYISTALSSIARVIGGVETKIKQTEQTLETLSKQLEGLVENMLKASAQMLAVIENTNNEFDTRQQIICEISHIRDQYFKRLESLASIMSIENKENWFQRKRSSSLIQSQISSTSPKHSLGIRPEVKILKPQSFTPILHVGAHKPDEAAKVLGNLGFHPVANIELLTLSPMLKPEHQKLKGSALLAMKQNNQLQSPIAEKQPINITTSINPKELRLRLQRIESNASHGSNKHANDFGSGSEFHAKSDQTIKVDKHPVIASSMVPPLRNMSNPFDWREALNGLETNMVEQRKPQNEKNQPGSQQTLEKNLLNLPEEFAHKAEKLDEVQMNKEEDSSIRFDSSGRQPARLETQNSVLTAQLPERNFKEMKIVYDQSPGKGINDYEELQGIISPISYAKTNTFGMLRQPTGSSQKPTTKEHTNEVPSIASRNPFMKEGENEVLDRANLSISENHENEMATIDKHEEQSDDEKMIALDLLKDMKPNPLLEQGQVQYPASKTQMQGLFVNLYHQLQKLQEKRQKEIKPQVSQANLATNTFKLLEEVQPIKHSTSQSADSAEHREHLSQDGDETIAKHTGRYTLQSVYRGLSPKIRLIDEAEYPDFGPSDSNKRSHENHMPQDFMDYELQPKPSKRSSIDVYQSTSCKQKYRVSNRSDSPPIKRRGSSVKKSIKQPKRPHVLIKKFTMESSWERQTGQSSLRAYNPNTLEVPRTNEGPHIMKGMFLKKKREVPQPSGLSGSLSARMNLGTAVATPAERSYQVGLMKQTQHRMDFNPHIQHVGFDFGVNLPPGEEQRTLNSSQREKERLGKEDRSGEEMASRHNSNNRKYP